MLEEAVASVQRLIDGILAADSPAPARPLLLQELVAGYWSDLLAARTAGRLKPATLRVYRLHLRRFLAYAHRRRVRYVSEVSPQLLGEYREWLRRERRLSVQSVESETSSTLSPLLRRAARAGELPADMIGSVERWKRPRKVKRAFSRREIAAVWRGLRRQPEGRARLRPLRFALWTGCRREQARLLAWESLDLQARRATLVAQKADPAEGRTIVLPRRVVRMLRSVPRNGDAHVFGPLARGELYRSFTTAAREAGIRRPYKLHNLRDTFVSWALNDPRCELRLQDVARHVGHSDLRTTMGYLDTDLDALERKLATLR